MAACRLSGEASYQMASLTHVDGDGLSPGRIYAELMMGVHRHIQACKVLF